MLMALLVFIGLAPAQAAHDPCLGPTWAQSKQMSLACDFDDARTITEVNVPTTVTGQRTRTKFTSTIFTDSAFAAETLGDVLLVNDQPVLMSDAPKYVQLMGPSGGWVDASGTVHGPYDSWVIKLSDTRIQSLPAGTLVSVVKRKGPPEPYDRTAAKRVGP